MNEFVSAVTGVTPEQDRVGTLMLSRPPTNALTRQMYREVIAAAYELGERTDISAVILYGGHEIFCAGDDV
ncbi:enoyl-CoA hydratase-related protein, partial [Mycolicibacterium porcinum]